MKIDVEVKNLIETQRDIERKFAALHGPPMLAAMRDSALIVERDAKRGAPVDTGRLRASLTPEVRLEGDDTIGVVGSNVEYAPHMEFGTRPHFPPVAALETWARRHGMDAYLVARAIARHGTKARRFLQNAFTQNKDRIVRRIQRAVREIVHK